MNTGARANVIRLRRAHPEWSSVKISINCGISKQRTAQILVSEGLRTTSNVNDGTDPLAKAAEELARAAVALIHAEKQWEAYGIADNECLPIEMWSAGIDGLIEALDNYNAVAR